MGLLEIFANSVKNSVYERTRVGFFWPRILRRQNEARLCWAFTLIFHLQGNLSVMEMFRQLPNIKTAIHRRALAKTEGGAAHQNECTAPPRLGKLPRAITDRFPFL